MRLLTLLGAGLLFVGSANAALLFLDAKGRGSVDLAPGESVEINLMITIRDIDAGFHSGHVFLNDDNNFGAGEMQVTAVAPDGDPDDNGIIYTRSDFELPADISWDDGNEFRTLFLTADHIDIGGDGTEATFVVDTLTVTHNGSSTEGTVRLTFERGARSPLMIFVNLLGGFSAYIWGVGLEGVIPNFMDPGIGGENNPFIINLVPGAECEGDANGDGTVDPLDSGFVLARTGCEVGVGDPDCDAADQNGDGSVDPLDSGFVLARFGPCE